MTWLLGGIGLITSGVIGALGIEWRDITASPFLGALSQLVYAASVLFLAVGLSRDSSIVGRGRLGIVALAVHAVWPLWDVVLGVNGSAWQTPRPEFSTLAYLSILIPAAAAILAVTQIARAGTVPARWGWVPGWVFLGQAVLWAIPQILFVAVGSDNVQRMGDLVSSVALLSFFAGTIGLGAVAVYLAGTRRGSESAAPIELGSTKGAS